MAFYASVDELIAAKDYFIDAVTVGHILHISPQALRESYRNHPEGIGYPFTYSGTRVVIPRIPFLRWIGLRDQDIFKD